MSVCSHSGATRRAEALPEGLCPQCLLNLGLFRETQGPETEPASDSDCDRPEAGERFGPYKTVRVLGEGGMGIVYLAEQQQPIRRLVALKVIKHGMSSRGVIARFDSERQALALMDHPNIAHVFDAGVSGGGQPYFVMEYVSGIHITEYCDQNRLRNRERIELFLQVCQAVQHAHQKGVIHRDIKPSNVLVGERDGKPFLQVIDFGIAKATDQRLAEYTVFTQLGQLLGTPEYMSPEQAEVGGRNIDLTTDVYSLGVLLYQLLVGALPFEGTYLRAAGLWELLRIIREEEPPTPASRLAGLRDIAEIAAKRRTDPATMRRQLAGDLNWIVLKAIEKDKERRYGSASELAGDIRRYLSDQPVVARPPSVSYHLEKFARRHKAMVAAVAAVFAVLVAGVSVSTWEAVRANHAEAAALLERDRALAADRASATAFNHVLHDLLAEKGIEGEPLKQAVAGSAIAQTEAAPGASTIPDSTLVRQHLETASSRAATLFGADLLTRAAIERTIGNAYVPLGLYADAQRHLEHALELNRLHSVAEDPPVKLLTFQDPALAVREENTPATLATNADLGLVYSAEGNVVRAEGLLNKAFLLERQLLGAKHPETLQCEYNLGDLYFRQGRAKEAESCWRETVEGSRSALGEQHPFTQEAVLSLAIALQEQGKYDAAEPLLSEVLRSSEAPPDGWPDLVESIGRQRLGQRRYIEAEKLLRETAADYAKLAPRSWKRYNSESRLGESLTGQNRYVEAEKLLLSSYNGMLQHEEAQAWPMLRKRLAQAGERIVQLYQDWGKLEQAKEWRRKLMEEPAAKLPN